MDLLGFSNEDLDSINSHGNTRARVTFEPVIEPMPDLKTFSEEAKQKYIQTRQSEIQRLKTRYNNQNTRINQIDKNSQLARVQKFVKKLKSIGDDNGEDLVHELKELNLKKFLSEAAHSLSESKMQLKDLNVIIEVSSIIHQTYPEFSKLFEISLKKQHKEGDWTKKRNVLRLVTEMIANGL